MDNSTFHNNTHLSFEELTEYNNGNLSNAEMHRLELHLISCELCKDALDGMKLIEDEQVANSIARIEKANQLKEESQLGLYHYIGIAASIIVIAVLGWVFSRTSDSDNVQLAEETTKPELKEEVKTIDTSSSYAAIDSSNIFQDTTQLVVLDEEITNPTTPAVLLAEEEVAQAAPAAASGVTYTEADEELTEISDTSLVAESIVSSDSIPAVTLPVEEEVQSMAKRAAAQQETTPSLADETEDSAESLNLVKAEPPKGPRAFNRYLRRNLNYPENAKENNIEGDVELTVQINSDGSIGDILIAKSLGYGCDEEAVRLVREGGNWTPATRGGRPVKDTVSVTVAFK